MAESYEQACAEHEWNVPERYNIAADVCDKHPRDKPAMVWERFDGATRELEWGELQDLSNQAAHLLREHGVERGDRVAVVLPPTPETAAIFFGTWKLGGILLSMSVLYGDDGIRHRLEDSTPRVLVTDRANAPRFDASLVDEVLVLDDAEDGLLAGRPTDHVCEDTSADDPAQLYYTSGTTGWRRASSTPTATSSPTRSSPTATTSATASVSRHGGVGVGGRHLAAARAVAPRRQPVRLPARGGFDPDEQLGFLSRHGVTNVFTTPTAMRAMMAIEDAGERFPQQFRIVCSAGEPLNPEAIRWFREQYGVTVLDYYGLTESYPLCANFPFMEVREGSMGRPMPGWDVQILDEDEHPVAAGERGEICLRARSNPHYPIGYWNLPEASEETFGGEWFHSKDAATMDDDGYVWYAGRADDVIIAAGYRIGPFEVESACIEHPAVREAAAVASPDEVKGNVVKAFIVLADGHEPSDELAKEIQRFVRERLSAYAYPRRVEFTDELPKTLTGKIRRIELREAEREAAERTPTGLTAAARGTPSPWVTGRAGCRGAAVLSPGSSSSSS